MMLHSCLQLHVAQAKYNDCNLYLYARVLSFFFNVAASIECTTLYTFCGKYLSQEKNESLHEYE